jgi:inner membrane protein
MILSCGIQAKIANCYQTLSFLKKDEGVIGGLSCNYFRFPHNSTMDTLTHAISGAVLGRATTGLDGTALTPRRRVAVGFIAAAFPDIDFALRPFVDPITFLGLHRGATHSLILLPLWALLLAWVFARLFRRDPYRPRDYLPLAAMGIAIHIAGDVITAYGTMIFAPFSDYKAAIPTTFIIDPWFTGILLLGLIVSWFWRSSRIPAVLSLAVLVGYVGFQGIHLNAARQVGEQYAHQESMEGARVTALPQPLSPFNWQIVVESEMTYRIAAVNLRAQEAPEEPADGWIAELMASYRPPDDLRWRTFHAFGPVPEKRPLAREAWQSEAMEGFRNFARFPYAFGIEQTEIGACVWFRDLRFSLGDQASSRRAPFRYGACRDEIQEKWQLFQHGDPPQPIL